MKTHIRISKGTIKILRAIAYLFSAQVVNHFKVDEWVSGADIITKDLETFESIKDEYEEQTGNIMIIHEIAKI